jgi:hypothetical protein
MNAAPPIPYFLCRICGSRDYEKVIVKKRDGRPYDTPFFACMGCTTMFGDPTKYSKPPPAVKVTRVDAPISFRRSRDSGRFEGPKNAKVGRVTAVSAGRRTAVRPDE